MIPDISQYFKFDFLTKEKIIETILILAIGLIIIYGSAFFVRLIISKKVTKQTRIIINRFIIYVGLLFLAFVVFKANDVNLTALFGAAGVLGIIIGVASQASLGNIVSGFFLVSEKSFELGDVIRVGDKTGTVYSIDLLSIKIKTFDNLLIRIPNQTVISTELVNVTKFPIRRMDINVSVAYKEDLTRVKAILEEVARNNPLCLEEPEPVVLLKEFASSSIDFLFGVWFEKQNFVKVKNSVIIGIKEAFNREGIEIPFPHLSIYKGEATDPFPVEVKK